MVGTPVSTTVIMTRSGMIVASALSLSGHFFLLDIGAIFVCVEWWPRHLMIQRSIFPLINLVAQMLLEASPCQVVTIVIADGMIEVAMAVVEQLGHCVVQGMSEVVKHLNLGALKIYELRLEVVRLGTIWATVCMFRQKVTKRLSVVTRRTCAVWFHWLCVWIIIETSLSTSVIMSLILRYSHIFMSRLKWII